MRKTILLLIASLAISFNINAADKGGPATVKQLQHTKAKKRGIFRSHSMQIGEIGGRYQVHSIKVRGLDTPNLASIVIYDSATEELMIVASTGAPGLGGALLGAASQVGSAAVFGRAIRPSTQTINNGSGSVSNGSQATAAASASGGSFVPPGHQNHHND